MLKGRFDGLEKEKSLDLKRLKRSSLNSSSTPNSKQKKRGRRKPKVIEKFDRNQPLIMDFYRSQRGDGARGGSPEDVWNYRGQGTQRTHLSSIHWREVFYPEKNYKLFRSWNGFTVGFARLFTLWNLFWSAGQKRKPLIQTTFNECPPYQKKTFTFLGGQLDNFNQRWDFYEIDGYRYLKMRGDAL